MKLTLWILCVLATTAHANVDRFVIPVMDAAPIVDGKTDAAEWISAAVVPFDGAHIALGRQGDFLFVAVETTGDAGDRIIEVALTPHGGETSTISAAKSESTCPGAPAIAASGDDGGFRAEVKLPATTLGIDMAVTLRDAASQAVLRQQNVPLEWGRLPLACRFLTAGSSSYSNDRSLLVEVVNSDTTTAQRGSVKLAVTRGGETLSTIDLPAEDWLAQSTRRYRVVCPRDFGKYTLNYRLEAGDAPLAEGSFDVDVAGPLTVEVRPFFLLHGGVFVTARLRADKPDQPPATVTWTLADLAGKPVITQSHPVPRPGGYEMLLDMTKIPPGSYQLLVESRDESNAVIARYSESINRPAVPGWWKLREGKVQP